MNKPVPHILLPVPATASMLRQRGERILAATALPAAAAPSLRLASAFACACALLAPLPALAAENSPWRLPEYVGWALLAIAPLSVFLFWWGVQLIAKIRRSCLLGQGMDASGDAMALLDRNHVYIAVNDAYGRMLDIPPERIAGQSVAQVWGEKVYEDIIRGNLERCFAGETVFGKAVVPLNTLQDRYIEVVYTPVRQNGAVRRVALFLMDATRRVEAERALHEREHIYATLVEGANSVILRVTPSGHITFINSFGLQFFGYTASEILGRHLLGLILPEIDSEGRNLRQMWQNVLADLDKFSLNQNENIKKSGERAWFLWSNRALRNEHGEITEILCVGHDITPLEKSRRELQGLRQALDQAGYGLAVTDLDGRIRFANPAWANMHGVEEPDLLPGSNVGESFEPISEGLRLAELLSQAHVEGGVQTEMTHLRRDLSTFSALTSVTILRGPAGDPDGLVFMAVDMSERKQLVADLNHSRKRLNVIVDHIEDIVFSLEPSGRFIYMSPAVRSIFGYEPSEVAGKPLPLLIHPDDRHHVADVLRDFQGGNTAPRKLELRGSRKDGGVIWVVISFSCIFDELSLLTQVVGVVRDMTERRRMNEELQESQERFSELVKAIEEAYWLQDGNRLLYTSPGFQPIFGIAGETLHDTPSRLMERIHPEDRPIAETLWNGRRGVWAMQDMTLRVLSEGQNVRWIRARTFPVIRDGVFVRTAGVAQDVTAYTEALVAIRSAKEEAERANAVKNEFLARMGHEFRTPLNGVLGMLQLLTLGNRLAQEDALRVAAAEQAARTLQALLDHLLEYVSLESCTINDHSGPFSIRDILRGLESSFAPRAKAKGLALHVDSSPELDDICGDGAKIRGILTQFLDNAVKFTDAGEVRVRVVQETLPGSDLRTVFIVEDSGPGIPAELRQSIFEPFVQADGSYTRRHGGAGLGLGIARQLSRCIGAELRIGDSPLGGARLELSIILPKC